MALSGDVKASGHAKVPLSPAIAHAVLVDATSRHHPYCVEDETSCQGPTCKVRVDRRSGRQDAVESLHIGPHRGIASANASAAMPGFKFAAGTMTRTPTLR